VITVALEDAAATERLGVALAALVGARDVILLEGDLGAGKTTLVRGLARGLGGQDRVTSPTFTLRHEYSTIPALTHVDCWRLRDSFELDDLGLDEVIDADGILVIEWGEFAAFRFAPVALRVVLADADRGATRVASIDSKAPAWQRREVELLACLEGAGLTAAAQSPATEQTPVEARP
jgi:tRNA threonylcarbamoyl adenosine modification protein YjeE